MSFQTEINIQQAPAVTGDIATDNPRITYPGVEDAYIVGTDGIYAGRFVWIYENGRIVNNFGEGKPDGFVAREQLAVINEYLGKSSLFIASGTAVTIFKCGDFFVKNENENSVSRQKCFASNLNGTIKSASTGVIIPGFSETDFNIAITADINELTVITCSSASNPTPPISEAWYDEFGDEWADENEDIWTT